MPALPGAARGRHGRLVPRTLCLAAGETRGSPASPGARRRVGSSPRGRGLLLFPPSPARVPGDAHLGGERAVLCPLCLWAGRCFLGHREVTNRACDFSLSQRVGLYVRYLAEQGQCVQTELRARWLVARILRALLLQAGARSHQSRTGSGVQPPLSQHFVHQWAQPGGLCVQRCRRAAPCTVHETVPGSNQTPESSQAQQRAGPRERAGRRAETPGCTPSPAAFTAPEAPLPRSPLYSEHKRH